MEHRPHRSSRAARRRARLVRTLVDNGLLTDRRWVAAFAETPRHVFLERFFRAERGGWSAMDRDDPGFLDQVYADRVLVTQLDGDPGRWARARNIGVTPGVPTSSSSQPGIMAVMLEALLVGDGDRVLEIGTGTGYNAALLCHRLGADRVTTVDIDQDLTASARAHLAELGYRPHCVAGDGADGCAARAPFDRVLATCAVASVPPAWLAQTRPGGLVVTTLHRPLGAGLVRIIVREDGTGQGRVLAEDGRFMPLRAHRITAADVAEPPVDAAPGDARDTELGAALLTSPRSAFEFYAGLVLPDAAVSDGADGTAWLVHPDGSWARVVRRRGRHLVVQGGPRRLWDLLEDGHAQWCRLGMPTRERFGITVTPRHQELWLDDPAGPHRWPLGHP